VQEGVEVVFGYPGGCNLPMYDALQDYPVRHVLVRHEQNAGHAADGFAKVSGKVGVAFGTSGPGATNLVTAVATAMLDSTPVVFVTGQVPAGLIGTDAFQETDVTGVTLPITKHNYLVMKTEDIAPTLREAFHIARSGRPGPVLVDIPKDVQVREIDFEYPTGDVRRASERRPSRAPEPKWDAALALIAAAKRPLILAGQGVSLSGAHEELQAFAEKTGTPVAFTLMGLDAMPSNHPLALSMMGMHGEAFVNTAIQNADLLLAFGMRFDDRVTGKLDTYARNAKKIHIDIDPAELNKNVPVEVAIASDLKTALRRLLPELAPARHDDWLAQIRAWRGDTEVRDITRLDAGDKLWAAHVIHDLWAETDGNATICTDVGQHQMWVAQYYRPRRAHTFVWSGGLGTMGYGLPSAMGAQFAVPKGEVWVVAGDGGFQMSIPELATIVQERLPVKIAIINNGFLGMVRQWQEFFYDKNYAATPLLSPDFVKLADAYGIPGIRVSSREQVRPAVRRARETNGPVLVEFQVVKEDIVYPMVPAGTDLDKMIRRPLLAEREE
jgi:acetolactate synthase-1/2/3 large subunit